MVDYLLWLTEVAGLTVLAVLALLVLAAMLGHTWGRAVRKGQLRAERDARRRRRRPPPQLERTDPDATAHIPRVVDGGLCIVGHYVPAAGGLCRFGHRVSIVRTAAAATEALHAAYEAHLADQVADLAEADAAAERRRVELEQTAQRQAAGGW